MQACVHSPGARRCGLSGLTSAGEVEHAAFDYKGRFVSRAELAGLETGRNEGSSESPPDVRRISSWVDGKTQPDLAGPKSWTQK